jgi:hypothetical protein
MRATTPKVRLGAKAQVSQETPLALAGGVFAMKTWVSHALLVS